MFYNLTLGASGALLLPLHDPAIESRSKLTDVDPGVRAATVQGVLAIALPQHERAHSNDPRLQLLVSQLGIALRNARLHASLLRARDEYRGLFEAAREGLLEAREGGRLLRANSALARMLGYPSSTALLAECRDLGQLFAVEDNAAPNGSASEDSTLEHIETLWHTHGGVFEARARRRDGALLWVEISVRARALASNPRTPTMECALLDVTDRKQRERAERAQLHASAAAEARSEFLAHISHEIRTPLNAIVGASALANRSADPRRTQSLLRAVDAAARQLQALVSDVLDSGRLDAGQLQLESTTVDVRTLLDECVTLFAPQAEARGLLLEVHMDAAADPLVEGDPLRLRQVLHNLLGNALKFTHRGSIRLHAELHTAATPQVLILRVRDTGIGMDAATTERVFQPFAQADAGIARRYGGSGLGLSIVRRLVELMHGQLEVESTPGKGSEFSCTLPLRRPAKRARTRIDGLRVLLVDDNALNREVADALLRDLGAAPTLAESGFAAARCIAEAHFDLVLLDIHMPELDGFATAELLRQQGVALPPIVALSADTTESALARARVAGFLDYLRKPLERERLAAMLQRIVELHANGVTGEWSADIEPPTLAQSCAAFDAEIAIHRHGDNAKLLARLLREFALHYADAPEQLRTQLDEGRIDEAARLAHNLKSVAGSFAAQRLAASSARLEAELDREAHTLTTGDALAQLAADHASFMRALHAHLASQSAS